jgi:hypothetical protein
MPPLHRKPRPFRHLFALFAYFAVKKLFYLPLGHLFVLFACFTVK